MLEKAKKYVETHKVEITIGIIVVAIASRRAYNAGYAEGLSRMPRDLVVRFGTNTTTGSIDKLLINGVPYVLHG